MKKASKKVVKKPNFKKPDFDKMNWVKEESFGGTHDFDTEPEFIGKYLRTEEREGKSKGKNKKEKYNVLIFNNGEGSEVSLASNHQIKQAVDKHGECWYKIVFTDMKKLESGRKVRRFEISTAQ